MHGIYSASRWILPTLIIVWGVGLEISNVNPGNLFSCTTPSGDQIFTDSPTQLKDCREIDANFQQSAAKGEGTTWTTPEIPNNTPPLVSETKTNPPSTAAPEPKPTTHPHNTQQEAVKTPQGPQSCPSSVNPLNPFLSTPCPSSGE